MNIVAPTEDNADEDIDADGDVDMIEEVNLVEDLDAEEDVDNVEDVNADNDDEEDVEQAPDYEDVLSDMSKKWLATESNHRVSKEASNAFWRIATEYFEKLYDAKRDERITKKTPQFSSIRKKLYIENLPKIKMQLAYQHKTTEELTIVEDVESTPVSRFPPSQYRRLYEIASVDVSIIHQSSY